jgi:hypothetical protein
MIASQSSCFGVGMPFHCGFRGLRTGVAEFAGERTARQAAQEQLAVARAAADRATAELVELARRLAAIVEAEIVPKWQSRLGRAWGWFLRN